MQEIPYIFALCIQKLGDGEDLASTNASEPQNEKQEI